MFDEQAMRSALNHILTISQQANAEAYEAIKGQAVVQKAIACIKANDPEQFDCGLLYPIREALEGLMESEGANRKKSFLFLEGEFIERHFRYWFMRCEGMACCADKSRSMLKRIAKSLATDEEITLDYTSKDTFNLPEKILKDHTSIMRFFDALYSLYYGNPSPYLEAMKGLLGKE